ncbi:MAG: metallophosphoesterase [Myxococcales bacterium]|nr:metallophosphoesterase [Myxococcales bacterium]
MSIHRWLIFVAVVLGLSLGMHYYAFSRLVRPLALPASVMRLLPWFFGIMALSIPLGPALSRLLPRTFSAPIAWIVYGWMGLIFITCAVLLVSEILRLPFSVWVEHHLADVAQPERRRFVARGIAQMMAAASVLLSGYGVWEALRKVRPKIVDIHLRKLPPALSGLSVVQLTDLHIGPLLGKHFIEQLVKSTNQLAPDIIAITGDLVDGSVSELGKSVAALGDLRARYGVYFVTGNHEYYSGATAWVQYLTSLNIRVLRNERVRIEHDDAAIEIAGIDDWSAGQFSDGHGANLPLALANRDASIPVILLAHQPRAVIEAATWHVDLQLSGHTHGGQIFPFNFLVRLQQPYVSGLHWHGPTQIYVSQGAGFWGPPMRLGHPAEITHLRLHAPSRDLEPA